MRYNSYRQKVLRIIKGAERYMIKKIKIKETQLKLQQEIVERIKDIQDAKEFPTQVTALCDYCGFKSKCPSFKHQLVLDEKAEKSMEEFKKDDGLIWKCILSGSVVNLDCEPPDDCPLEKAPMPCGHAASEVVTSREGTSYCAGCEREARGER
jgi:hypothetical protein